MCMAPLLENGGKTNWMNGGIAVSNFLFDCGDNGLIIWDILGDGERWNRLSGIKEIVNWCLND